MDPEVFSVSFSPYELMIRFLFRISYRFTQNEISYLEEHTQAPVCLFSQDGKNQKWLTLTKCRQLVKQWKKFRTPDNPICSDQELDNLEKEVGYLKLSDFALLRERYETRKHPLASLTHQLTMFSKQFKEEEQKAIRAKDLNFELGE